MGVLFQRGGQRLRLGGCRGVQAQGGQQAHVTMGQRAGFVEHGVGNFGQGFQRMAARGQQADAGQMAGGGGQCCRGGQR